MSGVQGHSSYFIWGQHQCTPNFGPCVLLDGPWTCHVGLYFHSRKDDLESETYLIDCQITQSKHRSRLIYWDALTLYMQFVSQAYCGLHWNWNYSHIQFTKGVWVCLPPLYHFQYFLLNSVIFIGLLASKYFKQSRFRLWFIRKLFKSLIAFLNTIHTCFSMYFKRRNSLICSFEVHTL